MALTLQQAISKAAQKFAQAGGARYTDGKLAYIVEINPADTIPAGVTVPILRSSEVPVGHVRLRPNVRDPSHSRPTQTWEAWA